MAFEPEVESADSLRKLIESSPDPIGPEMAQRVRTRLAQLVLAQPDEAHKAASALASRIDKAPLSRAWAQRSLGDALVYLGRFEDARSAYSDSVEQAEAASRPDLAGQVLVSLVGVLAQQGRDDEVSPLAERAESLLKQADDRPQLARLHASLGNVAHHRQDYTRAYKHYKSAQAEFEAIGSPDAMRVVLRINLGNACTELLRTAEAREAFHRAEHESLELELDLLAAQARLNRAVLESLRGQYRLAIDLLEQAEETFRREEAQELLAATQLTRAETYIELGMSDEAATLAEDAAATYRASGMELDAALSELAQARALRAEGRHEEAHALFTAVQAFYQDRGLRGGEALAILERAAGAAVASERVALAREAAQIFDHLHFAESRRRARLIVSDGLVEIGRIQEARAELTRLGKELDSTTSSRRADFWRVLSDVQAAEGSRMEALKSRLRAVRTTEDELLLLPGAELRLKNPGQDNVHRQLLELLVEDPAVGPPALFRTIEWAHDRRSQSGVRTGGDWQARREELASMLHHLQKMETDAIANEDARIDDQTAARTRQEIRRIEQGLLSSVRAASLRRSSTAEASVGERVRDRADSRLGPVSRQLRDGQSLIQYAVVSSGVVAVVVRKGRARAYRLPLQRPELGRRVRRWQMQLESFAMTSGGVRNLDFHRASADRILSAWSQDLIEPLLPDLEGTKEIIVVPHGILHQVPFEALRLGDEYIDETWRVRRVPSVSFLGRSASKRTRVVETDLVLATIESGPPGATPESKLSAFTSSRRTEDPTADMVVRGLQESRTAHWITHGVFREDNPLFSRFATQDGALFAADLKGKTLPLQRLVLSACESGRVVTGRSDDLAGVVVTFLEAGVERLVASHWRVHDEATIRLMDGFYEQLRDHEEAEAMRRAGQATRREWNHPFYWAAFGVYG